MLLGDALILELDEEVVAAVDVLEPSRVFERRVLVADHERLEHVAAKTARGGDDALGVLGPEGRGLAHGLHEVAMLSGTFGKAFGSGGAFLACDGALGEALLQTSGAFRYTTALAPPLAGSGGGQPAPPHGCALSGGEQLPVDDAHDNGGIYIALLDDDAPGQ